MTEFNSDKLWQLQQMSKMRHTEEDTEQIKKEKFYSVTKSKPEPKKKQGRPPGSKNKPSKRSLRTDSEKEKLPFYKKRQLISPHVEPDPPKEPIKRHKGEYSNRSPYGIATELHRGE